MEDKKARCPSCEVTTYKRNTKFKCCKCGWETIIEKDNKGKDIQIN